MALDPTEGKQLAVAVAEVARHYPTTVDPKVMAWVNFAMVAGMIYGPRIWVIRERNRTNRVVRRQAPTARPGPVSAPTADEPVGDDPDLADLGAALRRVN